MNWNKTYPQSIDVTFKYEPSEFEKKLLQVPELTVALVENRFNCNEIMSRHTKFLPDNIHCGFSVDCKSVEEYNKLLTSRFFWDQFYTENILIIQHDSALLRTGIEEFYKWDYVGAPWTFQQHGGNGGLSFRKKSAMIECIEKIPYNGIDNEDVNSW